MCPSPLLVWLHLERFPSLKLPIPSSATAPLTLSRSTPLPFHLCPDVLLCFPPPLCFPSLTAQRSQDRQTPPFLRGKRARPPVPLPLTGKQNLPHALSLSLSIYIYIYIYIYIFLSLSLSLSLSCALFLPRTLSIFSAISPWISRFFLPRSPVWRLPRAIWHNSDAKAPFFGRLGCKVDTI